MNIYIPAQIECAECQTTEEIRLKIDDWNTDHSIVITAQGALLLCLEIERIPNDLTLAESALPEGWKIKDMHDPVCPACTKGPRKV